MKQTGKVLLGAGVLALGAAVLGGKKKPEEGEEEENNEGIKVGYAPSEEGVEHLLLADSDQLQRLLERMGPVEIGDWESPTPCCGHFYQTRRGDLLLDRQEKKSICFQAIFNTCRGAGADDELALERATNSHILLSLCELIVSGFWNDQCYGTFGCDNGFVGSHGRGFVFRAVHADNRGQLLEGQSPIRTVPLCEPGYQKTGMARWGAQGSCRMFLWIPMINEEALIEHGRVTTEGVTWPDGASGLEPPPEVRVLGCAGRKRSA